MPQDVRRLFLSYSSSDRALVEGVARALRERGVEVFLDRWYLTPGQPWPEALERAVEDCDGMAVFVGPRGLGRWQQREKNLGLDRLDGSEFSVIPILLPGSEPPLGFLKLLTWVDLRGGTDDPRQLEVLARAARGEPPGPDLDELVRETRAEVCPYRGLEAFREEDAAFFFGREAFVDTLEKKLEHESFVAVVGPSGSGKSSVVRAGLLPRLRRGRGEGEGEWEIATLVPTERPLNALARSLVPLCVEPAIEEDLIARQGRARELKELLESDPHALRDLVDSILERQRGTDRLLLVFDQWEELHTLCVDDEVRDTFVAQLLDASAHGRLSVVLTLRSDFLGRAQGSRQLVDRLQDAVVQLGPMDREELRAAIEEPARAVGLGFESGLVARILDHVEAEPGSLPLLEFVLQGLWEERRGGKLLTASYEALGELRGAIAARAEQAFAGLAPAEQAQAQRVFTRLVQPGLGAEDTRRRARTAELGAEAAGLLEELTRARLLVADRDPESGDEQFEVAHEALIRHWKRLRDWVDEDRDFLTFRRRLGEDLADQALLYGPRLQEARRWLRERSADLSEGERALVRESDRIEKRNRRWLASFGLAAGLIIAVLAGWGLIRGAEAQARDREVTGLTDAVSLARLEARSEELLGALGMPAAYEQWLGEARSLLDRQRLHGELLTSLRTRGRAEQGGYVFDEDRDQWLHDQLEGLIAGVLRLERESVRTMRERAQAAEKLVEQTATGADARAKWNEARESGLWIPPQVGLIPIGRDPSSQLWEFAIWGTGHVPARAPITGELERTGGMAIVLVLLPAGSFQMGGREIDEQPIHEVTLEAFLIGKYEVTEGEWNKLRGGEGDSLLPASEMNWLEAKDELHAWGLILPTESQWEYACRGGTTTEYWSGDSEQDLERVGWYRGNSDGHAHPVGEKPANPFGLHDVHGNLWEWCRDSWSDGYSGSSEVHPDAYEPRGAGARVYRGGCFDYSSGFARSAMRRFWRPDSRGGIVGFRPARALMGDFTSSQPPPE